MRLEHAHELLELDERDVLEEPLDALGLFHDVAQLLVALERAQIVERDRHPLAEEVHQVLGVVGRLIVGRDRSLVDDDEQAHLRARRVSCCATSSAIATPIDQLAMWYGPSGWTSRISAT